MSRDDKAIREGYDKVADKIVMPDKFYNACLDMVGKWGSASGRVLDVGCGQGLLLKAFGARFKGSKLFGCDQSLELSRRTARNIGSNTVVQGDIHFSPYKDSTFSLVTITEVLDHVEDPLKVLVELRRILVPGGRLIATVPNREWLRYDRYMAKRTAFQPVDDRWFKVEEIKDYVRDAGFKLIKIRGQENLYFGGGPGRLAEKVALKCAPGLNEKMKRLIILAEKS